MNQDNAVAFAAGGMIALAFWMGVAIERNNSPSEAPHTQTVVYSTPPTPRVVVPPPVPTVMNEGNVELTPLEAAIMAVESGGDTRAIGDNGHAIGPFQLWPVMVEEANRINGIIGDPQRFTSEDRYSMDKSVQMFRIYQTYWLKKRPVEGMDESEVMARRWNGGCRGETKSATLPYWDKVRQAMRAE